MRTLFDDRILQLLGRLTRRVLHRKWKRPPLVQVRRREQKLWFVLSGTEIDQFRLRFALPNCLCSTPSCSKLGSCHCSNTLCLSLSPPLSQYDTECLSHWVIDTRSFVKVMRILREIVSALLSLVTSSLSLQSKSPFSNKWIQAWAPPGFYLIVTCTFHF